MQNEFNPEEELSLQPSPSIDFDDIAHLDVQKAELRETIISGINSDVHSEFRPVSATIYGPRGSGKRRLLRAAAGEIGQYGYDCIEITSLNEYPARPPEFVDGLIDVCVDNQPVTILLDCLGDFFSEEVIRVIGRKLSAIREQSEDIVVLSIMDEDDLYGPLRMFLRHMGAVIEVERPGLERRASVIDHRLARATNDIDPLVLEEYDTKRLAREADQFGINDIERFVRRLVTAATATESDFRFTEADVVSIIQQVDTERVEKLIDEETLTDVEVPEVTFEDIGGHQEAKQRLVEQVTQALSQQPVAAELNIDFGSGILLHGPPGTGKTMLVRALANELDYTFIPINASLLKGRDQSAQRIPSLFYRAQRNAPAILFFDEFDLLGTKRGTVGEDATVNTLLTELDGVEQLDQVAVIAATNRPETLDPALLRPGRFDYHVEIDRPTSDVQAEIFETHTDEIPLAARVTPEWFAEMTETVTGAEIAAICERAVTIALREDDPDKVELTQDTLESAYEEFKQGRLSRDDTSGSPAFQ